jgi:diadenosine tetraphosphate (Ap4A) HIT family hydrolase
VSLALKELTRCDKINIAAIGNVVPQLHVHIVARWKTDPLCCRICLEAGRVTAASVADHVVPHRATSPVPARRQRSTASQAKSQ